MSAKKLQSIRGIHDGLPVEVARWQRVEQAARKVFGGYAFAEVRMPILEPTELFVRSVGEDTDIVSKEMYAFTDQGGDNICLRPEGTAGAVRAWLQGGLTRAGAQRWYYIGPMFRRERPQKGRLRQFQQIGVEMFSAPGPVEDAEVLAMAHAFLCELGIPDLTMEINSLGCDACRPAYRERLVTYLQARAACLCETCVERIARNPMRVLDCKVASCQQELADAPEMVCHLCDECDTHFTTVQKGLDALQIPYRVNPRIVRGLDYYNRTAFEIVTDKLGAQGTVLAGGRYDGLVQELGGPATPAIGFAAGIERLAMLLEDTDAAVPDVAVVALGEAVHGYALAQADLLRKAGLSVVHCGGGSAKRQFKMADRECVRFVAVIGEDEMQAATVMLKNMASGEQQSVATAAVAALIAA
ncbi:MAG: histidine--tRNA ligase [Zetaproteobacteria bacterium CG12_big_fil_rev_8_21_14_0_65_54_13]|nr:MAG: histidine--tRNA ligase [Zetaproteobacteria bacterium CG12_big_fil_rev_8_21_14_0_65_54_13]PIX53541.1 MAG: histidine--tRNA ligase [Zetaproteobacteria bacterium CG_4_10_14_3_um_filter_54_28]PJA28351.1 MAG: histidine--tRNA ligase [Zetaproteobacteria bacterium CG_4_9_14_3_um_filter_54_145]